MQGLPGNDGPPVRTCLSSLLLADIPSLGVNSTSKFKLNSQVQ